MAACPLLSTFEIPRGTRRGDVIEHWDCPSCGRPIPIVHRAGRPRLYCTHACRQRAYRWRRRHGIRTTATPELPAPGAYAESHVPLRKHALRSASDPIARRRDSRYRKVTVCGLLARPNRFRTLGREFRPGSALWVCQTCATLVAPHGAHGAPARADPPTH